MKSECPRCQESWLKGLALKAYSFRPQNRGLYRHLWILPKAFFEIFRFSKANRPVDLGAPSGKAGSFERAVCPDEIRRARAIEAGIHPQEVLPWKDGDATYGFESYG